MNLLSDLDPAQVEAVKKTEGPVLILAGAGSGKTRVLTYKVAYLISNGADPNSILAVTFTNKAANEMKERIIKLLVHSSQFTIRDKKSVNRQPSTVNNLPFVGTFHAFCAKLLRIDGKYIGIPSGYLIYDDDDSLSLIKKIMKDNAISTKNFRPSSILSAISSAKGELVDENDYAQFARGFFAETVSKVYGIYQKELKNINACDFDDLLGQTVKLFRSNPPVVQKYSSRYKYVLVDEYQDVNTAQYELTKLLASTWGNLTVVGDASQAIYSFRGADFRNILNFERDFPKAAVFNLEQNYRSTQNVLSAANAIITRNTSHPVLKLWTKNPVGEKLTIYNAQNEIDEANFVVDRIVSSKSPFSSFAVLYRTNAQSRTVEEAFLHANIPYRLYGGVRFYERKEIKDVLAYLRLIFNPKDNVAKNRLVKLGKKRFGKFQEIIKKIEKSKKVYKPIELIDKVLEATDYITLIDDGTEQGLMRVENVKELKSVASDFENLGTLLENVALMEGMITPEKSYEGKASSDVVTLMTAHAAKGLEFDTVFVIGLEEGLFPHSRSMLEMAQLEEERRLAYVALTRAQKKIYLTFATQRLYFGITSTNLVSRFVTDIPEELINSI
ncbi:MAG TPA: UvrD-helicase domain-containing protein [Patescibacteria group bacterium]|nr:UvrD-helicase domain-containing protein [Patescibacteria group bacterium]